MAIDIAMNHSIDSIVRCISDNLFMYFVSMLYMGYGNMDRSFLRDSSPYVEKSHNMDNT